MISTDLSLFNVSISNCETATLILNYNCDFPKLYEHRIFSSDDRSDLFYNFINNIVEYCKLYKKRFVFFVQMTSMLEAETLNILFEQSDLRVQREKFIKQREVVSNGFEQFEHILYVIQLSRDQLF